MFFLLIEDQSTVKTDLKKIIKSSLIDILQHDFREFSYWEQNYSIQKQTWLNINK